jgi:hypothetical protein
MAVGDGRMKTLVTIFAAAVLAGFSARGDDAVVSHDI